MYQINTTKNNTNEEQLCLPYAIFQKRRTLTVFLSVIILTALTQKSHSNNNYKLEKPFTHRLLVTTQLISNTNTREVFILLRLHIKTNTPKITP